MSAKYGRYGFLAGMRRMLGNVAACAAILAVSAPASSQEAPARPDQPAPLVIAGNLATLELAPVLLAASRMPPGSVVVRQGNVAALHGDPYEGLDEPFISDLATNAETQILRASVKHPDLRTIATIAEGHYRVVARASRAGTLAELRGKRVGTSANTSAGFYLHRALRTVGMTERDVTVVSLRAHDLAKALIDDKVDAIAIWEPWSDQAVRALGAEAVVIETPGVYYEWFNLHTTQAVLDNPAKRASVTAFLREMIAASAAIAADPTEAQRLVAERSGHALADVISAWPNQKYPASLAPGLLDVMVDEEAWLAANVGRQARSREQIAKLIDPTVLEEARQSR